MTKAIASAQTLPAAADRKGLMAFGFAFGAVTAAVVVVACAMVHAHADGRMARSDVVYHAVVAPSSKLAR